jgi:hypothetical protein
MCDSVQNTVMGGVHLITVRPGRQGRETAQRRPKESHFCQLDLTKSAPVLGVVVLYDTPEFTASQASHFEMVEK